MTGSLSLTPTRQPIPYDAPAGAEIALRFGDVGRGIAVFLAAVAACSPYLKGLMLREDSWLRAALGQPVDAVLPPEFAAMEELSVEALGPGLRQAKRRVALWTALCDLGGVWTLEEVTAALTLLADRAVEI